MNSLYDKVYIIESGMRVVPCWLIQEDNDFVVLQMPSGGMVRLRKNRAYCCKDDAEADLQRNAERLESYSEDKHYRPAASPIPRIISPGPWDYPH